MKRIYLDNAASTPVAPEVISMMSDMMKSHFANPSSSHSFGRESKIIIENARKSIANLLNTSPGSIFFTSGGTEADNIAIQCGISSYSIQHAITSKLSHHAVLDPIENFVNNTRLKLSYIDIDKNGVISKKHLKSLLRNNPKSFVSIMHANNEIGTLQDIKSIGKICKEYDAIFHSDTVQTIAHFPFNIQELDVHFMAASAHKFHGPKGIGFIYISNDIDISPLFKGGGQERNMRAGTENVYGIAGMAMAMEMAYTNLDKEKRYIKELKSYMIEKFRVEMPEVEFYGKCTDIDNSLYTVLSVHFPDSDINEMLLFNLDIMGIACSGGSACASGDVKGSHVFSAILPNSRRKGIRFSFSRYNTKEDIDYTITKLKELFN